MHTYVLKVQKVGLLLKLSNKLPQVNNRPILSPCRRSWNLFHFIFFRAAEIRTVPLHQCHSGPLSSLLWIMISSRMYATFLFNSSEHFSFSMKQILSVFKNCSTVLLIRIESVKKCSTILLIRIESLKNARQFCWSGLNRSKMLDNLVRRRFSIGQQNRNSTFT
jgi:hypothetical protein